MKYLLSSESIPTIITQSPGLYHYHPVSPSKAREWYNGLPYPRWCPSCYVGAMVETSITPHIPCKNCGQIYPVMPPLISGITDKKIKQAISDVLGIPINTGIPVTMKDGDEALIFGQNILGVLKKEGSTKIDG